jgi:hypothetical protein
MQLTEESFILFELARHPLPPTHHCHTGWFGGGGLEHLSGQGFIVSSKHRIRVQTSNWKVPVAFKIIVWCWESDHKFNFCSPLHW